MKTETSLVVALILTFVAFGLNSVFLGPGAVDHHHGNAIAGQLDTALPKSDLAISGTRVVLSSTFLDPGTDGYDVKGRFVRTLPFARVPRSASTFKSGWGGRDAPDCAIAPGDCCVRITFDDDARAARLSTLR